MTVVIWRNKSNVSDLFPMGSRDKKLEKSRVTVVMLTEGRASTFWRMNQAWLGMRDEHLERDLRGVWGPREEEPTTGGLIVVRPTARAGITNDIRESDDGMKVEPTRGWCERASMRPRHISGRKRDEAYIILRGILCHFTARDSQPVCRTARLIALRFNAYYFILLYLLLFTQFIFLKSQLKKNALSN